MQRKLLVIDDEPGITKAIRRIAEQEGFQVKVLLGAMCAMETFLEFAPDVVMLDMLMPERDGIDVLHDLLLADAQADVVLMSGHGASFLRLGEAVARFHGNRRVRTLQKPFRRDELVVALQPMLEISVAAD